MVFQLNSIELADAGDLEKIKKDLGDFNFHMYEAYKVIEAAIEEKRKGVVDFRKQNASLKGHLAEAARLNTELQDLAHKAVAEKEQEAERGKIEAEKKMFFKKMEDQYNIRVGFWDGRSNSIEIKDVEGHALTFLSMPHMMGFQHPDFKTIFEDTLVTYLHRNGLLIPGKSSRGFDIEYLQDSLKRLHDMGARIDGSVLRTRILEINLNSGTPTEKVVFHAYGKSDVLIECTNVKGRKSTFIIKAETGELLPFS